MELKRFDVWLANLSPAFGTEAGKIRPVVIIQTDLLNNHLDSTIVLPITTNVQSDLEFLRVHLSAEDAGLDKDSDILIDQFRAIDNKRFVAKLGTLPMGSQKILLTNIKVMLDIE